MGKRERKPQSGGASFADAVPTVAPSVLADKIPLDAFVSRFHTALDAEEAGPRDSMLNAGREVLAALRQEVPLVKAEEAGKKVVEILRTLRGLREINESRIALYGRCAFVVECVPSLVACKRSVIFNHLAYLADWDVKTGEYGPLQSDRKEALETFAGKKADEQTASAAKELRSSWDECKPKSSRKKKTQEGGTTESGDPPPEVVAGHAPANIAEVVAVLLGVVRTFAGDDHGLENDVFKGLWQDAGASLISALSSLSAEDEDVLCNQLGAESKLMAVQGVVTGYFEAIGEDLAEGQDIDKAIGRVDRVVDWVRDTGACVLDADTSQEAARAAATEAVVEVSQEVADRLAAPEVAAA